MRNESIDIIMDRLFRGETLMIDDEQWRSYIRIESGEKPARFVMRSVLAIDEDLATEDAPPKYVEQRFVSLASALLSLTNYQWRS